MTDLQLTVLRDRYALPGETSWAQVAHRVADAVGNNPNERQEFRELLEPMFFVPGGRILYAIGNPAQVTPYNCFVLPSPEDSRGGIINSLHDWIEVQARGGGVGINMSTLRPRGALVRGVQGTSSGPVNWMELFATATHRVIQQGGSRRGAAMLLLNDSHPDILEFIQAKRMPGVLLGANLSVAISDKFMQAVAEDREWELRWGGELHSTISARGIWNLIIESAWASGEPGVVFLERANKESNAWYCEELIATNPCAEQPLGANGSCLLGALNLAQFTRGQDWRINDLGSAAAIAIRFLDNIIDQAFYPFPEIERHQKALRRVGLGTMGLADALIQMKLHYGLPEAVRATEDAFRHIKNAAYFASADLAQEKGAFPDYDRRWLQSHFVQRMGKGFQQRAQELGVRNAFLLSQAPTGTTAKLTGVWAGIEPYFDKETFLTNRLGNQRVTAPDSPYLVTANEVTPSEHIAMMAAVQRHVDSAVSKTVNAPEGHSPQETAAIYQLAYQEGLKSVAYYRDKSRQTQVQWHKEEDARNAPREWESPLECRSGAGACALPPEEV